jgi:hypothetical protein
VIKLLVAVMVALLPKLAAKRMVVMKTPHLRLHHPHLLQMTKRQKQHQMMNKLKVKELVALLLFLAAVVIIAVLALAWPA